MNAVKSAHLLSLLVAASVGLGLGACKSSDFRAERVCKRHCSYLEDCNNTDYDNCVNTCIETAAECDSDADVEMALDKLDQCRQEACNEIPGCEIDAWLECKL
jgi:hypothetical protein